MQNVGVFDASYRNIGFSEKLSHAFELATRAHKQTKKLYSPDVYVFEALIGLKLRHTDCELLMVITDFDCQVGQMQIRSVKCLENTYKAY